jgi:hypothetical protein
MLGHYLRSMYRVLIFDKNWIGLHFGRFFYKLNWPPCYGETSGMRPSRRVNRVMKNNSLANMKTKRGRGAMPTSKLPTVEQMSEMSSMSNWLLVLTPPDSPKGESPTQCLLG